MGWHGIYEDPGSDDLDPSAESLSKPPQGVRDSVAEKKDPLPDSAIKPRYRRPADRTSFVKGGPGLPKTKEDL